MPNPPLLPPRLELARLPTPIDHLANLGAELGVELYVKRDDLTGCTLSGNKVRKLEYVLPDVLEQGADVLLTCGGVQSNYCRTVALAARRLDLDVELFLRGLTPDTEVQGNLLLTTLAGPTLHAVDDTEWAEIDVVMGRRAEELEAVGRQACVVPLGASSAHGCLGYVRCMEEIVAAQEELGVDFDIIVSASGSGGTLAGLLAGAELCGFEGRIVGVATSLPVSDLRRKVDHLLDWLRMDLLPDLRARVPADAILPDPDAQPPGDEALARIRDVAVLTGLVLDPTYTNRAFGGLLGMIREGDLNPGDKALFLHTGGVFGLFSYAGRLAEVE